MTNTQQAQPSVDTPERKSTFSRILAVPTTAIFAISLALAVVVLYLTGSLDGVVDATRDADLPLLLISAPIYLASLWLLAYRWHLLVRMAKGSSDLPKAAEAFLTSVIINYAAPVGLAVPSRAALTKRALGLDASQTGTIALWEIAFDVLVLGTGAAIWMIIADGAPDEVRREIAESSTSYVLVGAVLALLVAAVGTIAWRKPKLRQKLASAGAKIMIAPTKRPVAAAFTLAVSVVYWLMQGVVLWMLVTALGVDVSASFMLGFTSLPILVGMLSPIPGGAAVREGLMYVVARLSGYAAEADAILAAALIYRFALFAAIPILFGLNKIWLNSQDRVPAADERT
ncbi:MAG TPA: lysylphosphatidylglycerol synthase transmembrane domain-containing protein [Thermomicrobiales bacterium]|nr:lysylphosphatidylglycerol synthase transmembrane domain-containing protein [Thermomicrobiales bacterium]